MTTSRIELPAPAGVATPATTSTARDVADWSRIVVATIARAIIATILGMAIWATVPALIGWHPTTVMTGSMEPRLAPGDVVVSRPVDTATVHIGQIILFDDPDHPGMLRMHRVHAVQKNGELVTKGDANPQPDSSPIERSAVHGVAFIRVPYLGLPILWLRDGETKKVLLLAIALTGTLALTTIDASLRRRGDDEGTEGDQDDDGTDGNDAPRPSPATTTVLAALGLRPMPTRRELRRKARMRRRIRTTGAAIAVVSAIGVASVVVPAQAWAVPFGGTTTNAASTFSAQSTFDCMGRTVTNSPLLTYQYSAASGTAESDLSGNGKNATLSAGVTRVGGTCDTDPYITLNGTNGQVTGTSAAAAAPTTFSVETWFQTSTAGGKLIGFGNSQTGSSSSYDRQVYMTNAGKLVFGVYNLGYFTITSTSAYNDGKWHDVVATMSTTGGMALYVDGVSVGTNTNKGAEANTGWWRIGYDNVSGWAGAPTNAWFTGNLDDSTVYPTALTTAQVNALYTAGR